MYLWAPLFSLQYCLLCYIIPNPHQCRGMTCETIHTIPFLEGLDQRLEIGRGSFGAVYEVKLNGLPCIAKGLYEILLGLNNRYSFKLQAHVHDYRMDYQLAIHRRVCGERLKK